MTDTTFELDDKFFVNLTNPMNASSLTPRVSAAILNDDAQPSIRIDKRHAERDELGTTKFQWR